MVEKLKQLAREPLIHFLLIGAAIYALYGFYSGGGDDVDERMVTVTSGEIQSLADQFTRLWNRPPTEEELSGALRAHVRTQILYREAVAMGLDDGDMVIERRLAQKVEMLAQGLSTPSEPSDEVLAEWYAANPDPFRQPDRYSLRQIFFDPDKREASTLDDARAVLEELNGMEELPGNYNSYGDRFMLQSYYPNRSVLQLRKLFGGGFVDDVIQLEPGRWHGPVLSGYGAHLVFISAVFIAPQPDLDEVRDLVQEAWTAEQISEISERFIDGLVSRYEVIVEETEVPITVPGGNASQ